MDEKKEIDEGTKTEEVVKPLSLLDESKAVRDEILKYKEELKAENDRKEKLQSDALLGGTGGSRVEPTPVKEETPKEYNDRIDKEISEGKHSDD